MTEPTWHATVQLTVPFHDVDPMNVVWHGHYAKYFEIARCELLESIDYGYTQMRASGYDWPIISLRTRYPRPIVYRQRIAVRASINEYKHRLGVAYLITDVETGRRLTRGQTHQIAVDRSTGATCFACPPILMTKLGIAPT